MSRETKWFRDGNKYKTPLIEYIQPNMINSGKKRHPCPYTPLSVLSISFVNFLNNLEKPKSPCQILKSSNIFINEYWWKLISSGFERIKLR